MASASRKGNGYYICVFIDGRARKIYGVSNKRVSERTGEKIESLIACRKTGGLTDEVRLWLAEIQGSPLYDKLARLELVEERQDEKTLYGLLEAYKTSQSEGVSDLTIQGYRCVFQNLIEFFGQDVPLVEISKSTAEKFGHWMKTEKLNRRGKKPQRYGIATVNHRISMVKQIFRYAEKMEWMGKNLFEILKGGESVNPDKMEYVPIEKVLRVMEYSPLKWRVLIALVRFCGIRGASETYRMEWSDIHWSSPAEPGWISIRAGKNKRHGRRFRMVPLSPIVEQVLSDLVPPLHRNPTPPFPRHETPTEFFRNDRKVGCTCPWQLLAKPVVQPAKVVLLRPSPRCSRYCHL
ncbi:MAG: phage integrase SAM-like domain-containing protein [Planctomycetia bacterium]|nr:phage integrase SAM-like domain-containing protein [Planctomycetia bacterium]